MNALARLAFPITEARTIQSALVVDGNELQLAPTLKSLARTGVAQVQGARDGNAAMQALRKREWDVIVLDLDLEDVTGLQLIDVLADRASKAGLIIISSHPSRILQAASCYAGERGLNVLASLRKPLDQQVIRDVLDDHVLTAGRNEQASSLAGPPQVFTADELRQALLSQQIKPYFQPQHNAIGGGLRGAEVLARWHRADGTVLGPAAFLPAFEQAGLLECLTNYMLSSAFQVLAADDSQRCIAVNVPATVARSPLWAQSIADLATAAGADPARVVIEITEDGGAPCNGTLAGAVTQLRLRGFQCAIDDFGTGDSSLDRLMCVPFNEIKINRGMIAQAREHAHARSMLSSIIAMGRQLVATVVAEGIEDEEDLEMVRGLGCHVTQGYLHARPMQQATYLRYLRHECSG